MIVHEKANCATIGTQSRARRTKINKKEIEMGIRR